MKISTDTHGRKHTAHIRVTDKASGKQIENVVALDTETGILTRLDPRLHTLYTEKSDFELRDNRTNELLTPEQLDAIDQASGAHTDRIIEKLIDWIGQNTEFPLSQDERERARMSWKAIIDHG